MVYINYTNMKIIIVISVCTPNCMGNCLTKYPHKVINNTESVNLFAYIGLLANL